MPDPLLPLLASPDARDALRYASEPALSALALRAACARVHLRLEALGVRPGDTVAVWTHLTPHTAPLLLGVLTSGATLLPLNPALGHGECAHLLRDASPRAVLCAPGPHEEAARGLVASTVTLDPSQGAQGNPWPLRSVDEEPLLLLYTSGTTGAPKGAVLTARNVAGNVDALARAWELGPADRLSHALPLFHVHGLALGLLGALRAGASVHWLGRFEPAALGASLGPASVVYAVPTMYHRLAESAEQDRALRDALARARLLVSGSAALSAREHARMEALTGQRVVERYGLTETMINCAVRARGERRPGAVGPAVEGVEVRLVNEQRATLEATGPEALGEVAVRSPYVFREYLHRPDATAAARDAEGWFYTGDVGTLDADGYLRIVGRLSTDLLKTGGFKVGAGEVEACLLEHPEVREAAVVGAPDEDLGERIVAFVVPSPGSAPDPAKLSEWVRASLAAHKRPREVHLCDALPRNAMGKVLKAELRKRAQGSTP